MAHMDPEEIGEDALDLLDEEEVGRTACSASRRTSPANGEPGPDAARLRPGSRDVFGLSRAVPS